MVSARLRAAGDTPKMVMPGGSARAFCTPARRTSMPSSSMGVGTAENDDTVSTTRSVSGNDLTMAAISLSGFMTPVEVSLCTSVTVSNPPSWSFARTVSGSMGCPHSACIFSACLPHALATEYHLSENAPQQRLRTFDWTRFLMAASMTPHADDVDMKMLCSVPAIFLRFGWMAA